MRDLGALSILLFFCICTYPIRIGPAEVDAYFQVHGASDMIFQCSSMRHLREFTREWEKKNSKKNSDNPKSGGFVLEYQDSPTLHEINSHPSLSKPSCRINGH